MQTLGLDGRPPERAWWKELLWPLVTDEVSALTAARNGALICFLITALSIFVAVTGTPEALVNGAFFFLSAFGIRQLSLPAAGFALTLQVLNLLAALSIGQSPGILGVLTVLVLLGAVRAAWFARRMTPAERYAVANPPMDLAGWSRFWEDLPARLWPRIRVFYTVVIAAFFLLLLVGLTISLTTRL